MGIIKERTRKRELDVIQGLSPEKYFSGAHFLHEFIVYICIDMCVYILHLVNIAL